MAETWYDSFVEEENSSREAVRTAVLLAKTRYDEQLSSFVGNSEERLSYVRGEIDRIADETAAMTGAARPDVFQKLMHVIEADVLLPVTEPERVDVTENGEGGLPPERNAESIPEPTATTDVNDHAPVAEDAILDPPTHKIIPVQDGALKHGSCVRCTIHEASEGSPVCEDCNTELVALAATKYVCPKCGKDRTEDDLSGEGRACPKCGFEATKDGESQVVKKKADASDSLPLDSTGDPSGNEAFSEGDRIVFTRQEWRGVTGTVVEKRNAPDGACYVIDLDEEVNGYTRTPCFYPGAFARAEGDKAGEGLERDVESKVADVAPTQPSPVMAQPGTQPAAPQPAGPNVAQPLNPNAPYQCTVCGYTGTFQAVQDHVNTSQDTEHMRAKQNPAGQVPAGQPAVPQQPLQQAAKVADAPDPNDPPQPGGADTDPHDQEPVKAEDPQENLNPANKFHDIAQAMADRAAVKAFSAPADEEVQAIAEQYGLDPHDVRDKLVVKATFGDFTAVNGKVGAADVPQGYQKIDVQGLGGQVAQHQAIVPTSSAVRKVAEDLGMDENSVYEAIKESMGDDLGDQYHATVDGEHTFFLPADMAANAPQPQEQTPPPPQPQQPQGPPPPMQQPMPQQPMSSALLAKDLRIQAERLARRAAKLEGEVVEGSEGI